MRCRSIVIDQPSTPIPTMNPTGLTKSHRPSAARVVRIRLHYYLLRQYLHVLQVHKFYRIKCPSGCKLATNTKQRAGDISKAHHLVLMWLAWRFFFYKIDPGRLFRFPIDPPRPAFAVPPTRPGPCPTRPAHCPNRPAPSTSACPPWRPVAGRLVVTEII